MREDMITMRDGKVMQMRNGNLQPIEGEMTLSDGTRVMPNGQIVMANGTARRLAEGETMNMDGQMAGPADMSDRKFKEEMEDRIKRRYRGGLETIKPAFGIRLICIRRIFVAGPHRAACPLERGRAGSFLFCPRHFPIKRLRSMENK